jgi:uncharacterized membrane protein
MSDQPLGAPTSDESQELKPALGDPALPPGLVSLRPGFKNRIFTGLIFIVPLAVTVVVALWLYRWCVRVTDLWTRQVLDKELIPDWINPAIQFAAVIVTVSAILVALWVIGSLSTSFLMRRLVHWTERVVLGLPIVRTVYAFSKQIVALVAKNQERNLQRAVIIEYPKANCYALGFATGETRLSDSDELHVTLFVPTTPNPTSGFMLVLPKSQVRDLDLPVEEAVRMIMSGGLLVPENIGVSPYRPAESITTDRGAIHG